MRTWLFKTEPNDFSIRDLRDAPDQMTGWDGVRNYQARNFLAKMQVGDLVFIYHSSCKRIGIAGMVRVVKAAYPDPSQFNPESPYYDAKSTPEKPRWQAVDLQFERKLPALISLETLKAMPELSELPLVRKGSRLSVMPVSDAEWQQILRQVD